MKRIIKYILCKINKIDIDLKSKIPLSICLSKSSLDTKIRNSKITIRELGMNCLIENVVGYGNIHIENNVSISGPGTILHAEINSIYIKSYSSIAQNVSIQEFNHRTDGITSSSLVFLNKKKMRDLVISKGNITIEEDVWIGSNCVILSGVTIGRGAVIGAGSIVTKDVPRYTIMGGSPAKPIRKRFRDKTIEFIESTSWWTWELQSFLVEYENLNGKIDEMEKENAR